MARRPVPGSTVTPKDIEFEERCSGLPIDVRTRSGYPPPVPVEPEAVFEEDLFPEGYEVRMEIMGANKIGTIGDLLRLAAPAKMPPYARCVENPAPEPIDETRETMEYLRDLRGSSTVTRRCY